MVLISYFCSFW